MVVGNEGPLKGPAQECLGQRSVNRWSLSIIWDPLYTHTLHLQLSLSMSMSLMHLHAVKHTRMNSLMHSTTILVVCVCLFSTATSWCCCVTTRPPNSMSRLPWVPFFFFNQILCEVVCPWALCMCESGECMH